MATAKKKSQKTKKAAKKVAARPSAGDGASLLPVDDLINHQNTLGRLARSLERAGLRDQAAQIRDQIARLRSAILDSLIQLLGDREFQTREAATRTLLELLIKDPSIAPALIRARDTTADPEIRDRLRRRILIADRTIFQKQADDALAEAGPLLLRLLIPGQPQDDRFRRTVEELSQDVLEALEDAEAAKTDTDPESILELFRRFQRRETRRRNRQNYFDQLRRERFGD